MATEQGMFGPNPLDLQDQLRFQAQKENSSLDLGSLSGRAGVMLGEGINQLLGREDPRVSEAKQVQEAVNEVRQSGVDMSDPAAYYRKMAGIFGAKGLTKQAEMAAAKALEFEDKAAERKFNTDDRAAQLQIRSEDLAIKKAQLAKEMAKAAEKPGFAQFQALLKDAFANGQADQESIADAIIEFNKTGGDTEAALKKIKNKKEKATEQWGEPVERNVNGKVVLQQQNLTTKEWKTLAGNEANISTRTDVHNGMTFPLDQVAMRGKFLDEIKPYRESLLNVGSVATQLNLAGSNPAAAEAARTQFMKLFKVDSNMDKASIERALNTGSLDSRVIQSVQSFLSGTLTDTKIKNMREATAAIHKKQKEAIANVKKNYDNLEVSPKTKAFVQGTADLDQQSQDIDTALGGTQLSDETTRLMKKYGGK